MKPVGIYVVFDGPPNHEPGRFVEVEDETIRSVGMDDREWRDENDGLWSLGPFAAKAKTDAEIARLTAALERVRAEYPGVYYWAIDPESQL